MKGLFLAALAAAVPAYVTAQQAPAPDTSTIALAAQPAIVAPGVISTGFAEFALAVDPLTGAAYYSLSDRVFSRMTIMTAAKAGVAWSAPAVASFSGVYNDCDLAISPDGRTMVFSSNRPHAGRAADRQDLDLWRMTRNADGSWGEPVPLGPAVNTPQFETFASITSGGRLYFSRQGKLQRVPLDVAGATPDSVVIPGFGMGVVSPDERMLVFVGPGRRVPDSDLYVAFAQGGGWTTPRRLQGPVTSGSTEHDPSFSPDGRTLYFASERVQFGAPVAPRARRADVATLEAELVGNSANGLRNLYAVDVSELLK